VSRQDGRDVRRGLVASSKPPPATHLRPCPTSRRVLAGDRGDRLAGMLLNRSIQPAPLSWPV
jgi:hypothetical protein